MTLLETHTQESPRPHRFTREEYYQMADAGLFQNQRVELIEGEIIDMAPQHNPHYLGISLTAAALQKVFAEGYWVRSQAPLSVGNESEPEPDVAVVKGDMRSYKDHPTSALLVVEVSDSTLAFDRTRKAALYASRGINDYWIINVAQSYVEVMRQPAKDPTSKWGWSYRSITTLRPPQSIAPLARPDAQIPVAELLP